MPGRPEVGGVSKNWGSLLVGLNHENYEIFGGVLYFMVATMCFEDGKVEGVVTEGLEGIGFLKAWVLFPPANAGVEILDWRRWAEKTCMITLTLTNMVKWGGYQADTSPRFTLQPPRKRHASVVSLQPGISHGPALERTEALPGLFGVSMLVWDWERIIMSDNVLSKLLDCTALEEGPWQQASTLNVEKPHCSAHHVCISPFKLQFSFGRFPGYSRYFPE